MTPFFIILIILATCYLAHKGYKKYHDLMKRDTLQYYLLTREEWDDNDTLLLYYLLLSKENRNRQK